MRFTWISWVFLSAETHEIVLVSQTTKILTLKINYHNSISVETINSVSRTFNFDALNQNARANILFTAMLHT